MRLLAWCFVLALAGGARAAVDVAAPATGSIEGKVIVAATGEALAGVKLRLQGTNGAREPVLKDTREPVLSGADGAFRITGVAPGRAIVIAEFPVAQAGGWVTQNVLKPAGLEDMLFPERSVADWVAEDIAVTVTAGETRKDVLVRALKGGVAVVRVVSTDNRKPLADVPLTFSSQLSLSPIAAKTGKDGVAQVRLLPDIWQVYAGGVGSPGQRSVTVQTGKTNQVTVQVTAGMKVTGTVLGPDGKPAAGVVVSLGGVDGGSVDVTTDAAGRYEVASWASDQADMEFIGGWGEDEDPYLKARSADGKLAVIRGITETTTKQDLTLEPAVTISTKVEDPMGRPITNATATVTFGVEDISTAIAAVKPDAQGRIEIAGIPKADHYEVTVVAKGYGTMNQQIRAVEPPNHRFEYPTIVMPLADQQLGGQILDADGNPAAGLMVQAWAISRVVHAVPGKPDAWDVQTIVGRSQGATQTDSQGHFFFDQICGGPIQFTLSTPRQVTLQTAGGTTNMVLRLAGYRPRNVRAQPVDPPITIRGTVSDPSGAPAAGVVIGWGNRPELMRVSTDSSGRYSITWPKGAGTLLMVARDEQHNLAASHQVDSTTTNVDPRLNPGLTISVKAQDADGRPIPSATASVALTLENRDWNLNQIPIRADEKGVLEFRGLPQGFSYSAKVTSRGFSTVIAGAPLETTMTNRLQLSPAVLWLADPQPAAGARGNGRVPTNNPPITILPRP